MKSAHCNIQHLCFNSLASRHIQPLQKLHYSPLKITRGHFKQTQGKNRGKEIARNRNKEPGPFKNSYCVYPDEVWPYHNGRQDNARSIRSIGFIFIVSELQPSPLRHHPPFGTDLLLIYRFPTSTFSLCPFPLCFFQKYIFYRCLSALAAAV